MLSLRELQARFAAAVLAADGTAPALALAGGQSGAERIGIYRRTIRTNYRNALGATYPVVRRVVGAAFFDVVVDAYVERHPSRSGDLNEYGATFGDFLGGYEPMSSLSYLCDVARLEWAIDEANRAADSPASPDDVLRELAAVPAEQLPALRMRIHPSCRLIASSFPLLRIWQVNQPDHAGDLTVDFNTTPDRLRIRREPGGVALERIDAGVFAWLAALAGDATLAIAIERAQDEDAAFDLGAALHRCIGDGTIAGALDLR
jgi:hypothetical protein